MSAPTDPSHRKNNFDLLRLLAALQVVLFHSEEHLHFRALPGVARVVEAALQHFPGVPIFFVISGFLISQSLERNRDDLRRYATNRALRILPALYLCFLVTLACLATFHALHLSDVKRPQFWAFIFGQLTLGQFFTPDFLRHYGVGNPNGSLWTIPVEIEFYIILPFLYAWVIDRFKERKADLIIGALIVTSYVAYLFAERASHAEGAGTLGKLLYVTFVPHVWMFLIGVLACRNFGRLKPLVEGRLLWWTLGYLGAVVLFAGFLHGRPPTSAPAVIAASVVQFVQSALLAGWVLSFAFTSRGLASTLLRGNDISYGVYLFHMVVINVLVQVGAEHGLGFGAAVAIAFLVSMLAAFVSYRLVELPALRRKPRPANLVPAVAT